jgi:hypothetical protein
MTDDEVWQKSYAYREWSDYRSDRIEDEPGLPVEAPATPPNGWGPDEYDHAWAIAKAGDPGAVGIWLVGSA